MANHQDPATPDPTGATITPADIQRQEFGVSRFGGYRMRDVDEFLDRLTASTEAIIAENERLRAGGAPIVGTSDLDEVNRQADEIVQRARDEAARIVAEANEHAAVLAGGRPSSRAAAPTARRSTRSSPRNGISSRAWRRWCRDTPRRSRPWRGRRDLRRRPLPPTRPQPTPQAPVAVPEAAPDAYARADVGPAPTAPVPTTPGDEPVRVDEPQHAAAGDREGDGDPSLRRLFWGEEG